METAKGIDGEGVRAYDALPGASAPCKFSYSYLWVFFFVESRGLTLLRRLCDMGTLPSGAQPRMVHILMSRAGAPCTGAAIGMS